MTVLIELRRAAGTCSPVLAPSVRLLGVFTSWSPDLVVMIDLACHSTSYNKFIASARIRQGSWLEIAG
jgi:hypothetical protein